MEEYRYRFTACLEHRPRHVPGLGLVCANPWCGTPLQTARPKENTRAGINRLLDSLEDCLHASRERLARGDPLAHKGVQGFSYDRSVGLLRADIGVNLVAISGRRVAGRRTFSISGDTPPNAVQAMGLDNATANPSEATTQFDTTSGNRSLKAFDAGFATITAQDVSPVKVLAQATWTEADNPGPKTFVVRRIGLAIGTANTARELYSILGGTTPTNILALDFTGLASFTTKPQIEVTLSNQSAQ